MGLFSKLLSTRARRKSALKQRSLNAMNLQRRCTFETMEPRRMLSANPLVLGTVYIEEDLGSDLHGDRFEITFSGGAADTELTRLVINGDQNAAGMTVGDVFFDTEPTGLGGDHSAGFVVEQLLSSNPDARVEATVEDGSSLLVLDFHGFQAGDKLVFSIDVDEVEYLDPAETDLEIINEGFDPITSGVEFQGSQLTAYFSAPHYKPTDGDGIFWNRYDDALSDSGLDLPEDNFGGQRDRSTGAFLETQQEIDPASISGFVYADGSNDGTRDANELGLGGVAVQVIPVNTIETQATVTVTTDANGYYEALNLSPGTYRVVEVAQPAGYLDGLDTAGTVSGVARGAAVNPGDSIESVFLAGGTHGIEYNFGEILPASISGTVHLSNRYGDCFRSGGSTEPIADVTVHLLDESGAVIGQTVTDALGDYQFVGLEPGIYSVIEFTPVGLIDAGAVAGYVDQATRGNVVDPNTIVNIELLAGDQGVEYDFCEHLPSSISGFVYHDRNDNGLREAGEEAIPDTQVTLIDQDGNQIGVAQTDATGYYEFTGLSAGNYSILESQPDNWLDGKDTAGRVDTVPSGSAATNDRISNVELLWGSSGVEYNFGELLPGSIQGFVHADLNRNCIFESFEDPIANVKVELLDARGEVIGTTYTSDQGEYLFEGLTPGTYVVRETQPIGYFQGSQTAGSHGGDDSVDDLISQIPIGSGQQLVHYDFCEILPGSISGIVYVDPNQNEVFDSGETLLEGVTVQLLNANGTILATTQTNGSGYYEFVDLEPGQYGVQELQPAGYFQGGQQAGSRGGDDSTADLITAVAIGAGENLVEYNFSEIPPSSIQGMVYVSTGSCTIDPEAPIAGVMIELLDSGGNVVGTTVTDADGRYLFDNLRPGEYVVRETQPVEFFQGDQCVGSGGGNGLTEDLITEIQISPGDDLVQYNFYEKPPASISGFVFQDGPAIQTIDGRVPDDLTSLRDGIRTVDDRPIAGVRLVLRNGLTGLPVLGSDTLAGTNPRGIVTTVTDANGHYEFRGLRSGSYAVYEIHPEQYFDGIDTPGSTDGIVFNINHTASGTYSSFITSLIDNLAESPRDDAIVRIPLAAGQTSVENNFSEILVTRMVIPPIPPRPIPPVIEPVVLVTPPPIPLPPSYFGMPGTLPDYQITGSDSQLQMTWHLSVVNGGTPRGANSDANEVEGIWRTVSFLDQGQWVSVSMNQGYWTLPEGAPNMSGDPRDGIIFGIPGAIPIAGDFNGDGVTEIGLYHEGQWFIDVNGNGRWDEGDLWAKLGTVEDLPIVGDWDGDGKDDIGIFGPEWHGDPRAIKAEPGLPDPDNEYRSSVAETAAEAARTDYTPKNLPPEAAEATDGHRILKHTAAGNPRMDVIDHVFRFGVSDDLPIAGDWNGDGIRSIGVFRNGNWYLDVDGDGRLTQRDAIVSFGESGDVPVVGDFNGDGVDQIGIYREGVWVLDSDGNRELDAHDEVFRMGDADAKPVVGDWDGDGIDEPAIYRDAG